MEIIINPSLAAINDFNCYLWIEKLKNIGVKSIHFDLMDCSKTNDFGLPFKLLNMIDESINVDIHMMTSDPIKYIKLIPQRKNILLHTHYSMVNNFNDFINEAKKYNFSCGVTFDLNQSFKESFDFADKLDLVNFMSVDKIGNTNEIFQSKVFDNVIQFKNNNIYKNNLVFQVDGSVRENFLDECKKHFNSIVVGSMLYSYENLSQRFKQLEK